MARAKRLLPAGCSSHITLRCNSRQFLIAKALRRDVLLAVLNKAQQKFPVRVYGLCLMANHLHLLIKSTNAKDLPRLMHWFAWYSAMALNRLSGRCGLSTPIQRLQESEKGFMTPIPTMATTAGLGQTASVNGLQPF